ncbi:IS3-like element ISBxe1 family transposase [Paraburkholderia aromaticivorans]|uniref:IS3 family transposase n=3 Tax=Burkholderiales TaxID=80840 RepID=A0A248VZA9_9BURK|nr:IS3-like element ISBxe1 family transposase [Paraburkholderia aromaticivorans]ASW04334.1 IS3 family transposase [Paraburkholderia aromaticivorans]
MGNPRARYTREFMLEAVRMVRGGQSMAAVAKILGISPKTLHNWVKADAAGKLNGAGKQVSPEQMEIARLRAELARVKMERDILEKGHGVLCKGVGMKYAWIELHSRQWPVSLSCQVLGVSPSGYHARKARDVDTDRARRRISNDALLVHIKAVHAESKGEYGWPRVWKKLLAQGIRVSKDRVQQLMKLHGIRAKTKRRFKVTTDSNHSLPVAPDLLQRDFSPARPDQVWTTDITYIWTDEGWLFLTVILDLFSRQVVGWSMQPHMRTELVSDALRMAWFRRRPEAGLIVHSDRGSQYCSRDFQDLLKGYGMRSSMSRRGNCWDNAPTESLWGSLKRARILGQRFATRREAMDEVIDWLSFYNHSRLHSTLGYVSPMQFERDWYAAQNQRVA